MGHQVTLHHQMHQKIPTKPMNLQSKLIYDPYCLNNQWALVVNQSHKSLSSILILISLHKYSSMKFYPLQFNKCSEFHCNYSSAILYASYLIRD